MSTINKEFFKHQESKIEKTFKKRFHQEPFYNYYLSGNRQWDDRYFLRYKIDLATATLPEPVLNFDADFCTYYDFLVAQILCKKQLKEYLYKRITMLEEDVQNVFIKLEWTATKNDLIELLYALHLSKSIAAGKKSINAIAVIFSKIFNIELKEIHHAFHRMKTRNKSRTIFLDELKKTLEDYMDKDL